MTPQSRTFQRMVTGLGPMLILALLALAALVLAMGWLARRRLQAGASPRLAAELAAWTLCAVSALAILVGTELTPAFAQTAAASGLPHRLGCALAEWLGWSLQLPLLQVSVPFFLLTASLGAVAVASSEASDAAYRRLARLSAAAAVLLAGSLGWGLASMLAQQLAMRRLFP